MSHTLSSNCLSDLQTISGTLADVVKTCFGPKGQATLMSSSTGHVSLSTDGLSILSSLHLSHPTARSIIKSLNSSISHNGDGCKTEVFYLSSLFNAMKKEADQHVLTSAVDGEIFVRAFLSRSLHSFLSVDLPVILNEMTEKNACKMREDIGSRKLEEIVFIVMRTLLGGTLPDCSSTQLAKVVVEYLTNGCGTLKDVRNSCQWFDHSIFLIPHQMYSSTHVTKGIFLESRLYSSQNSLHDISLICMQCPLDGGKEDDGTDAIIHLNAPEILVSHKCSIAKQFLSYVKKLEVSLIITSSKVQDLCLQLCQSLGIAVIDCVDDMDLQWICNVGKKSPVTSLRDEIKSVNLLKATTCDKITFAQKSYTRIVLNENASHPKALFLCTPTQGISQQLKIKLKRGMIAIMQLLECTTTEQEMPLTSLSSANILCSNVIAGGGYFEILLCEYLRKYCEKKYSSEIKMCCRLLQAMLMVVPKALHTNHCQLFNQAPSPTSFLNLMRQMNDLDVVNSYTGLNPDGHHTNSLNQDVLDVLSIKVAIVYSTVSLAVSLLRMDKIIGVHGQLGENGESTECHPEDT